MHLVQAATTPETILKMYALVNRGTEVRSRDRSTRNIHNLAIVIRNGECPLTSFADRKLNLDYCKREWLWYLGADPKDDSIVEHAKMWAKLKQPDGSFYSNYGQYIFSKQGDSGSSQFEYCLNMLRRDVSTRRASMVLLRSDHLFPDNTDTVCTYAINFTVENNQLHMTVMMRSNDVIYGFTNDSFCFWSLHQFMFALLQYHMPNVRIGNYVHFANSMHVYEIHYDMITRIVNGGMRKFQSINVPMVTAAEAAKLIQSGGKEGTGAYTTWLKA